VWSLCRLNFRLNQACEGDLAVLCAAECSYSANHDCGGMGLRCLQSHQDEITTEECKKEIFYFEKMEADDYRNDVLLAEACRTDVEKHCKKVTPGTSSTQHSCWYCQILGSSTFMPFRAEFS